MWGRRQRRLPGILLHSGDHLTCKYFPTKLSGRFKRTADMLAKSGLLEITMKTADLLRSNQQAQRELEQLKVGQLGK